MPKKDGKLSKAEVEQALVDNFINLQKVLTNLSIKFDELSTNISKLLQLFEISAKSFTEKVDLTEGITNKSDKEFLNKLDSLLDQNKTIAKGIMMMEEKIRQRTNPPQMQQQSVQQVQKEGPEIGYGEIRPKPLPRY
jgi:hypothetical protein